MQTVTYATQKETTIDQQQHSCEMLICQHHQIILRLLSSAATASTRWRCRELNCPTIYIFIYSVSESGSEPMMVVVSRTTDGKFMPDPSKPKLTIY